MCDDNNNDGESMTFRNYLTEEYVNLEYLNIRTET